MKAAPGAVARTELEPVWRWYKFQRELIVEESVRVQGAFQAAIASSHAGPPLDARYQAMTSEDVDELFREQRERLDTIVMFELLATTEGALRIDFQGRVDRREKDPVSRRFRELSKKYDHRIQLEEHILDTWKELDPRAKKAVGNFRAALRLRNWLAHGRYWTPKLGQSYRPNDIFDIALDLLNTIGAAE